MLFLLLLLFTSILSAATSDELEKVQRLILRSDLESAVGYMDRHIPKPVINAVHEQVFLLEKRACHPTNHLDFGRVAFRRLEGFDTTNDIRCEALQIIRESHPDLVNDPDVESEFKALDNRDGIKKDPNLAKQFESMITIGKLPENRMFNGFKDVRIYNASLVALSTNRFINANFVSVMGRKFIATQSPIETTTNDFWQMIIDQNVRCIVAVNDCFDLTMLNYCPNEVTEPVRFKDIEISLKEPIYSESNPEWRLLGKTHGFKVRKLCVKQGDRVHDVNHFQYLNWADGYYPSEPCVVRFLKQVYDCQSQTDKPLVVHCRAGIGRTGLFLALYDIYARIQQNEPIDLKRSVKDMRDPIKGRSIHMMQNLAQYHFAKHFLSKHAKVK